PVAAFGQQLLELVGTWAGSLVTPHSAASIRCPPIDIPGIAWQRRGSTGRSCLGRRIVATPSPAMGSAQGGSERAGHGLHVTGGLRAFRVVGWIHLREHN